MNNKTKYNGLIRWGIIGCGNVTEVKSGPAYKLVNGFLLTAVMRRDVEKLKDYAERHDMNPIEITALFFCCVMVLSMISKRYDTKS